MWVTMNPLTGHCPDGPRLVEGESLGRREAKRFGFVPLAEVRTLFRVWARGCLLVMALFGAMPVASAQSMAKATDLPCYERDIQPILVERCMSCHLEPEHSLRTYKDVKMRAYGIYREVMVGNKNMSAKLTSAEREMFAAWYKADSPVCPDPTRAK